jgi:hypothetical protein
VRPLPAPSANVAIFEDALALRRAQNDDEPPPLPPSQVAAKPAGRPAYSLRHAAS